MGDKSKTDWSKVESTYLTSKQKVDKLASHNLNLSNSPYKLRLPHDSAQVLLAQTAPKKGATKDQCDKEVIEILKSERREQENINLLLFKHIKYANAEIEKLNHDIKEKDSIIEDLKRYKEDFESQKIVMEETTGLVKKLTDESTILVNEKEKILQQIEEQINLNKSLVAEKQSLENTCADYELLIKNSEEAIVVIYENLSKYYVQTHLSDEADHHNLDLFGKICQLQSMINDLSKVFETEINQKPSCGKLEVRLEKLRTKFESSEKHLLVERKQNTELSSELEDLSRQVKALQLELNEKNSLISTLKPAEKKYENLLVEYAMSKESFAAQRFYLEDQLKNAVKQINEFQFHDQQLQIKMSWIDMRLKQKESLAQFWMKKSSDLVLLQNDISAQLERIIKEKQEVEDKMYQIIVNNFTSLQKELVPLLSILTTLFTIDIPTNSVLSLTLPESEEKLNIDDIAKKFSDQTASITALLKFMTDRLTDQTLKKPEAIEDPAKIKDISCYNEEVITQAMLPSVKDEFLQTILNLDASNVSQEELREKFASLSLHFIIDFRTSERRYLKQKDAYNHLLMKFSNSISLLMEELKNYEPNSTQQSVHSYLKFMKLSLSDLADAAKQCGALEVELKFKHCWKIVFNYVASLNKQNE